MATDTPPLSEDLRTVLHHAPDFMARLDPQLRYRYVNAQAERVTGIPAEEWIGRTPEELGFPAQEPRIWVEAIQDVLSTGESAEVTATFRVAGRPHVFDTRVVPERDEAGTVVGVVLAARDVTDRTRAVQRLEETTRLLSRTLESLSEAVFVVDQASRVILDCNPAAERMFGWSRDELVGRTSAWLHRDEEAFRRFGERSRKRLEAGRTYRGHFIMRRKDGSTFPTEHTVTLLDPDEGLDAGVVSAVRDRTGEVAAARELHHYNRRLRGLHEMNRAILEARSEDEVAAAAASHALAILRCVRASVTLLEEGGARLAAVRGSTDDGPPEGARVPVCPFPVDGLARGEIQGVDDLAALDEPRPEVLEALVRAGAASLVSVPLGSGEELLGALNLSFSEPGPVDARAEEVAREVAAHLTLALRQIRLRKAVQEETVERMEAQARAESLQVRLGELLDTLELGLLRTTLDGIILERNDAARRILGLGPDETLVGRPVDDVLWPGESWKEILRRLESQGVGQGSVEARIRRVDGSPAWVSALARVVRLPDGESVVEGIFEDITEEMRLREEVVGISTQERLRIGQDLHDDLGQHLTGLAFVARGLARRLEEAGAPEPAEEARELERLANLAVKKTRHLARGVQPPALSHRGLPGALGELARDAEDLFDVTVLVEVEHTEPPASTVEASHLFRIAQEATTNAARHGGAGSVRIAWGTEEGRRILSVEDDGAGFAPRRVRPGLGLRIMRYRARLLGGDLEVDAEPGRGTRIRITLPPRPLEDPPPSAAKAHP